MNGLELSEERRILYDYFRGLLKNWVLALKGDALYDNKLPLGVFLEPEIVLNTLRQKTCRSIKKPLDELELNVTFGDGAINDSPFSFKVFSHLPRLAIFNLKEAGWPEDPSKHQTMCQRKSK
jgi:hypothetical protein